MAVPGRNAAPALRINDGAAATGTAAATRTLFEAPVVPENPVALDRTEQGAPPVVLAESQDAERPDEADVAPAQRLRDFRFLTAAETVREQELEVRLDRLERELETNAGRLRFSDSFSVRIDAQLDRARLERDLDQVHSEIGRLRLMRLFGGVAAVTAPEGAPTRGENSPADIQPISSDRAPSLDLLA